MRLRKQTKMQKTEKTKRQQTDKSKPLRTLRNYQEQRQPPVLRQWRTVWKRRLPYLSRSVRKRLRMQKRLVNVLLILTLFMIDKFLK